MLEFDAALSTVVEVDEKVDPLKSRVQMRKPRDRFPPNCWTRCSAIGVPRIICASARSICSTIRCCANRSQKNTSSRACWAIGAHRRDRISSTCI